MDDLAGVARRGAGPRPTTRHRPIVSIAAERISSGEAAAGRPRRTSGPAPPSPRMRRASIDDSPSTIDPRRSCDSRRISTSSWAARSMSRMRSRSIRPSAPPCSSASAHTVASVERAFSTIGPRREVPAEDLAQLVDAAARLERGGQLAGRVDPPGDDQLDRQADAEQPEPVEQTAANLGLEARRRVHRRRSAGADSSSSVELAAVEQGDRPQGVGLVLAQRGRGLGDQPGDRDDDLAQRVDARIGAVLRRRCARPRPSRSSATTPISSARDSTPIEFTVAPSVAMLSLNASRNDRSIGCRWRIR